MSKPKSALSELEFLRSALNVSLDAIQSELELSQFPALSSSGEEVHPLDNDDVVPSPRYYEARRVAVATLARLKCLIQPPLEKVMEVQFAPYERAGLEIVARTRLVEYLALAPDRQVGLHISELQERLGIDATKLRTILRLLASRGWFIETSDGVFANARPALQLLGNRSGWKATRCTPKAPIADALVEVMIDSDWKFSKSPLQTPFQIAHRTNLSMFDYMNTVPEYHAMFGDSMEAMSSLVSPGVLHDYPWMELSGKTLVDCGGGSGGLAVAFFQTFPSADVTYVIQDFSSVIRRARGYISQKIPDAIQDGRVVLDEHDIFSPQSKRYSDAVYILRWVLHDWPDEEARQILKHIATSVSPGTKILVIETIATPGIPQKPETALSTSDSLDALIGKTAYETLPPPAFVPANFGESSAFTNVLGLHIMSILNAHPRSLNEWDGLFSASGLRLVKTWPTRSILSVMEAVVLRGKK